MKNYILSLFILWNLSLFAQPQTQVTLTTESLWKLGRVSDPQVSPDSKSILYNVRYYDVAENTGQSDIYKVSIDGKTVNRLTNTPEVSETNARWTSDGRIGYLSDAGGEVNLYMMDGNGSNVRKAKGVPSGITTFGFSFINDMLYYTMDVKISKTTKDLYPDLPKTSGKIIDGLMYRHWNEWEDESYSHLFIVKFKNGNIIEEPVDVMPGEPYDTPMQPFGGDEQISWSPDGSRIAYTCKKLVGAAAAVSTNSDIYVYNVFNQKTENRSIGNPGYDQNPMFSPDGTQLLWVSMETSGYESDKNNIMIYDYGLLTRQNYTENFKYSIEKAQWSPDGKMVYFNTAVEGAVQLFSLALSEAGSKITQITNQAQDVADFSIGQIGNTHIIIGNIMSMSMPNELFLIDPTGKSKRITNVNTDMLSHIKMGKVEKREIKATDGKNILTWVIYPPDFNPKVKKKYPTLLYCQGGPQSPVSQFFSYRWNFQLMAANGYIVVAPNRRGLPGFGEAWNDQIAGDWGGQAMQDLLSSIDEVAKETYVDKDKLGCVGASYGGYSVYWMAGNHDKRFKCFIAHDGVFDMTSMYGTTEEMFFVNHDFKGPYWQKENALQYDKFSPHRFVQNWDAPILIIHNEKDFRVPLGQGMEAFTAAQSRGIPSRFLYFPDEGHFVLKPQNSILWQRVYFDWLDKYLK
jgi:dipeptidyl aminopeptidase/acylaminoacyl peptidase